MQHGLAKGGGAATLGKSGAHYGNGQSFEEAVRYKPKEQIPKTSDAIECQTNARVERKVTSMVQQLKRDRNAERLGIESWLGIN